MKQEVDKITLETLIMKVRSRMMKVKMTLCPPLIGLFHCIDFTHEDSDTESLYDFNSSADHLSDMEDAYGGVSILHSSWTPKGDNGRSPFFPDKEDTPSKKSAPFFESLHGLSGRSNHILDNRWTVGISSLGVGSSYGLSDFQAAFVLLQYLFSNVGIIVIPFAISHTSWHGIILMAVIAYV